MVMSVDEMRGIVISNCQRPDVIAINHSESQNMHRNTRRVFTRSPSIKILLELDFVDWHLKTFWGLLLHILLWLRYFFIVKEILLPCDWIQFFKVCLMIDN